MLACAWILTSYSKQFQGGQVKIVVGPAKTKKTFTIHKDLLVYYSDYFRAAFNGSFVESKKKTMRLADVDVGTFEDFHTWLYTRKFVYEDDKSLSFRHLTNLWVFGDYFQMPMLQNCVMDEIFAKVKLQQGIPTDMAKIAYAETVEGSLLRRASIEIIAYFASLSGKDGSIMADKFRGALTFDILHDLVKELDIGRRNRVRHNEPPSRDKCFFHVHDKDEHC
jgi:hypothetical protein